MQCEVCRRLYDASERGADRRRCPDCASELVQPVAVASRVPAEEPESITGDRVECPACAELIKARARVCRFCGYDVERGHMPRQAGATRRESALAGHLPLRVAKNPGIAAALAFLYPGLGHVYCGAIAVGIAIMIAPTVVFFVVILGAFAAEPGGESATVFGGLWIVLLIGYLIFQIWQIFDAYRLAERFNRTPGRDVGRVFGGRTKSRRRRPGSRRRNRKPRR